MLRAIGAIAALALSMPALAQMEFTLPPGQTSFKPIRIGAEKGRALQFLPARSRRPAPIVVMLDDWTKPGRRYVESTIGLSDMLRARGIAFALVPADRFARDGGAEIAQALSILRSRAAELEIDMGRLALLGQGVGASYTALLAMDPARAHAVGLDINAIRAAVLLDGECFDIDQCWGMASEWTKTDLENKLPDDEIARRTASPIQHAARPNARSFFIHFDPRTKDRVEGEALLKALREAGQQVTVSSALMRFDQGSLDRLDRARPNQNSQAMLDYLAAQLEVR